MNESFVLKSHEQITKPDLWKEQEWLELVTELSRKLPSLNVSSLTLKIFRGPVNDISTSL